jgi:hypothetical protein
LLGEIAFGGLFVSSTDAQIIAVGRVQLVAPRLREVHECLFRILSVVSKLHFKIAVFIGLVAAAGWFWLLAIFTQWLFVHIR